MEQDGTGWNRMEQDGTGWNRMEQDGTGWNRMEQDEWNEEWYKLNGIGFENTIDYYS